ncbi:MAG: hydrogen peroxide-inducible genes activator [Rhodospirillales bacterium]|nr:hydrogen peroxide-inducible genes activator [Rhodospirillales bacterium]
METLPTPAQLRYFLTLAELGHFGRAAAACGVSQASLSLGLQALERLLGAELMDRTTARRAVLTPFGREVIEHGKAALAALASMAEAASVAHVPLGGPLRLGIIPTIAPFLLPRLGPALRDHFPELRLFLRQDVAPALVDWLATNRLDVLILSLPADCGGAASTALMREDLLLAMPAGHHLAAAEQITAAMLQDETVLLLEHGNCLRDQAIACTGLLLREGDAAGVDTKVARRDSLAGFVASDLASLVQMVAGGEGVTVLPRCAVASALATVEGVVVRPLAGASRGIGLAWRQGSPIGRQFAAHAGPHVIEALGGAPAVMSAPEASPFYDRTALYAVGGGR